MVPLIVRADPQTTFQALISMQAVWADPSAPKSRSADSKGPHQPTIGLLQPPGRLSRLVCAIPSCWLFHPFGVLEALAPVSLPIYTEGLAKSCSRPNRRKGPHHR